MSEDHNASRDHARSDGGVREPAKDEPRKVIIIAGSERRSLAGVIARLLAPKDPTNV